MRQDWSRRAVAEFVGAFALSFVGIAAIEISHGDLVSVAFAHGLAIAVMVSAVGHISGGHFNPAITFAFWVTRRIETLGAVVYWVAQFGGAVVAALALRWLYPSGTLTHGVPAVATSVISPGEAMVLEAILTFFLVNAVMNAGISGKATIPGGLAIGLTLTFCILMGGPLTGASLNPARSIGPAVATGDFTNLWVYLVGPAIGGLAAGLLYKSLFEERAVPHPGKKR